MKKYLLAMLIATMFTFIGCTEAVTGDTVDNDNTKTEENPDGRFVWSNADVTDGEIALTDNDAVHPNAAGGKIYADYMKEVLAANPENSVFSGGSVFPAESGLFFGSPDYRVVCI